jgi:hypothetical protein
MMGSFFNRMGLAAALVTWPALGFAQMPMSTSRDVILHVNPRWQECAIQLDPSLTQQAWRQFTEEAALVAYYRPLLGARPLGKGKFEVSVLQAETGIDDTQSAWNDTFVHPYDTHWLFEGNGLAFPSLEARVGVSDRVDVAGYFTQNPNSNYGFYGGQVQVNVLQGKEKDWGAAVRLSAVNLFGPEDVNLAVFGLDMLVSREYPVSGRWASVEPYVGVSSIASLSHEKSAVVNLKDEAVGGGQAMIGAVARLSVVRIGLEFSSARVNSRTIKVGLAL